MQRFRIAMLVLATVLAVGHTQADELLPLPPDRPAQPQSSEPKETSVHTGPPQCLRWSDNCVSCTRTDINDKPACSNIGPACQPGPLQCLQTAPAENGKTTP